MTRSAYAPRFMQRKDASDPALLTVPLERKEYIVVPFEVKSVDTEKRTFDGYSATWDLDLGNDIIHKGAFARTIEHFKRGTKKIPLVDSHDYSTIMSAYGRCTDAKEDDKGLLSMWKIIDGGDGQRVMDRLNGGVVSKMSIGYIPVRFDFGTVSVGGKDRNVRNLYELKWEETSLVLFPMNPNADVDLSSVKSIDALITQLKAGSISDEQKAQLRALLEAPAPAPEPTEPKGLAPDAPERALIDARIRELTLLSLGTW